MEETSRFFSSGRVTRSVKSDKREILPVRTRSRRPVKRQEKEDSPLVKKEEENTKPLVKEDEDEKPQTKKEPRKPPPKRRIKKEDVVPDIEDIARRSKRQRGREKVYYGDCGEETRESSEDGFVGGESESSLSDGLDSQESEEDVKPKKRSRAVAKKPRVVKTEIETDDFKTNVGTFPGKAPPMGVAPMNWSIVYDMIRVMRKPGGVASPAAVDTMGCAILAEKNVPEKVSRFQTLVALMLSSQTKDTVTAVVMQKLQTELPGADGGVPGLTVENIIAVPAETLNQMIWAVGFHNNKTKYIKKAAEICRDKYAGDIPDTIEGLTALPGVGPKMGYLTLSHAWGKTHGIGVDVHVHRLSNLWRWTNTKSPEDTRKALESWLPKDRWEEINWLLVGFGQTICPGGSKSSCGECEVGLGGLCPAADRGKVAAGLKRRVFLEGLGMTKMEDGTEQVKVDEATAVKKEVVVKVET